MLRPLRGDYIGAALRTLIEWEHFLRSPLRYMHNGVVICHNRNKDGRNDRRRELTRFPPISPLPAKADIAERDGNVR